MSVYCVCTMDANPNIYHCFRRVMFRHLSYTCSQQFGNNNNLFSLVIRDTWSKSLLHSRLLILHLFFSFWKTHEAGGIRCDWQITFGFLYYYYHHLYYGTSIENLLQIVIMSGNYTESTLIIIQLIQTKTCIQLCNWKLIAWHRIEYFFPLSVMCLRLSRHGHFGKCLRILIFFSFFLYSCIELFGGMNIIVEWT